MWLNSSLCDYIHWRYVARTFPIMLGTQKGSRSVCKPLQKKLLYIVQEIKWNCSGFQFCSNLFVQRWNRWTQIRIKMQFFFKKKYFFKMYSFSLIISVTRSLSVWSWKTTSTWTPSVNISAPPAMSPFLDNSVTPWEWPWQKIRWWMKSRKGLLSLELSLWDSRSLFWLFWTINYSPKYFQVIPAAISTLIMVNAADLIGRKRLFIFPLFGYIVYNVSFLCNWFLTGSSWWVLTKPLVDFDFCIFALVGFPLTFCSTGGWFSRRSMSSLEAAMSSPSLQFSISPTSHPLKAGDHSSY